MNGLVSKEELVCQCGNIAKVGSFVPCNRKGEDMEPDVEKGWTGLYKCSKCGTVYRTNEVPLKVVVFDIETTGLNTEEDEILEIAMIDENENVLFHSLVQPSSHTEWPDAQKIHGISPEDVANAPLVHEIKEAVEQIFKTHNVHVAYNGAYDMKILKRLGISFDHAQYYDVMLEFAPVAGEYNYEKGGYKWQKLAECAAYFDYEYKAHSALGDIKATLHCWKELQKMQVNSPINKRR